MLVSMCNTHMFYILHHPIQTRDVKTVFFNKTGNRFVETSNLPVIGLRDVMCHMAAVIERKAAGEVKRGYVITMSTVCVNWPVVYSVNEAI